jgi:hypothetical protein
MTREAAQMPQTHLEVDVTESDRVRLAEMLGETNVDRTIQLICTAGAAEAIAYATGSAVFSTMTDLRMYRVYRLLVAGMTMDESETLVATLFKLTDAGARRVVASTLARYRYELDSLATSALRDRLEYPSWDPEAERWEIMLPAGFVRERAQRMWRAGDKPNPESKRGAVWAFPTETLNDLRSQLGLNEVTEPR